jgi:hypothetical protein
MFTDENTKENPTEPTKKVLELVSGVVWKVVGCKTNIF